MGASAQTELEKTPPSAARDSGADIARGSTILMVGAALSYGLAGLREILIARQFGATAVADAYLIAFALPLVISTLADYILAVPFVQVLVGYLSQDQEEEAWRVISMVLNILLVLVALVVVATLIAAPALIRLVAPGFAAETLALATTLSRVFFPLIGLFVLYGVMRGVLIAYRDFRPPAFAAAANHLCVVVTVLLGGAAWGVNGLLAGIVLGAVAQIGVQIPAILRKRGSYSLGWEGRHPGVRRLLALASLITLGGLLQRTGELISRSIASWLPEGTIAALNYANRLIDLPSAIIVGSIVTASLPTIVAQLQQVDQHQAALTAVKSLRNILLLIVPVAVTLVILARPIVAFLFQGGAFDVRATILTSEALQWYAPGLVAVAVVVLSGQILYALDAARWVVAISALGVALNIGLSLLLAAPLQHRGLALATTLSQAIVALLCSALLRARLRGLPERALLTFFGQLGLAVLPMALLIALLSRILLGGGGSTGPLQQLVLILATGAASLVLYGCVLWLLRVPEIRALPKLLRLRVTARSTR